MRYFRTSLWAPEKLLDKAGRLATRLIALNTVFKEKTGVWMFSPSLESALKQMIYRDISVKKSSGPTSTTKPSPSHQPSNSSNGSEGKPDKP
jgi:hypothetical protein